MDTNKEKMMAFLSSMTEEQAAAFMQMLTQQPQQAQLTVECHTDVADTFSAIVNTEWFVLTVNKYAYKEWSAFAFFECAMKVQDDIVLTDEQESLFVFDFLNPMLDKKNDKGIKLQQATAKLMGFDFEVRYKAADTVSSAVTWVFDATGRGIEWVGQKVVDAGIWTQDHAPDAGNLAGKPVRWATDVVTDAKDKVGEFKDAYKQVRDNKATE